MKNICIFASGGGSHFKSIYRATLDKTLNAKIALLVSDKKHCGAVKYAEQNNIPIFLTSSLTEDSEKLIQRLGELQVSNLILAGFIKRIPVLLINAFCDKIINIHPSLLPKYGGRGMYGLNVHEAVLNNKEPYTGCTVHLVNEHYDEGDILAQHKIKIPEHIKTAEQLSDLLKPIENDFYLNFIVNHLK